MPKSKPKDTPAQLKKLVRTILEDRSQYLLDRVEKMIEAAGENRSELEQAIQRVEHTVKLFVGAHEANLIAEQARSLFEEDT